LTLYPEKKYTIIVESEITEEQDAEQDPAFILASLAVDTHNPDLSTEHDYYLYEISKLGINV